MPITTTFTKARANLANLCNKAAVNKKTIIIKRRGYADVALIAASELSGLKETLHLLRSPQKCDAPFTSFEPRQCSNRRAANDKAIVPRGWARARKLNFQFKKT